jgi:hypothetical protein
MAAICALPPPMVSAANVGFPPTLRKHADWALTCIQAIVA